MQVPTVTLSDLQSFQAAHFSGPHNPLPAPATYATEDNAYEADDDLGYYADGVKRTLTDEQIKIFRHSEIHALLRARQLERDEVEYEARMRSGEEESASAMIMDESVRENVGELVNEETVGAQSSVRRGSKSKKRSRSSRQAENTSEPLDYDDQQVGSGKRARTETQQYAGRRIVSYAEE